jgi:glycine cleavage system H protein
VLKAGDTFGVVESVKAASDLYLPVAGTIIAVNTALESAPETVNSAPYEGGWMLKVKLADPAATASMLDADAYRNLLS